MKSILISLFLSFLYVFLKDFILLNQNILFIKFSFIILLQVLSSFILIFFLKIEFLTKFVFFKKISILISKQTYSVYLLHMIFIYLLIDLNLNAAIKFTIYVFLLIALSTITYYFVEKPILKTRPKYL
tara:strand:- start:409 stop:792 length:384 start_codon:yes stop_codon:yes gene_type:complete